MSTQPKTLKVLSSDKDDAPNVSRATWAAWTEEVEVEILPWERKFEDENGGDGDGSAGGGGYRPADVGLPPSRRRRRPTRRRRSPRTRTPVASQAADSLQASEIAQMLGVSASWELAVDYTGGTGVLDRREMAKAWDAGAPSVALRDIQASEKKQRDKLLDRLSGGDAGDWIATWTPFVSGVGVVAGGLGLLAQPGLVKNERFLTVAVICFALALGLSLVAKFVRRSTTVNPGRLDLINKQARIWWPRRIAYWSLMLLLIGGAGFAIGAVTLNGDKGQQDATISEPVGTTTADGVDVSLTVAWKNLGSTVKKVRITVVALPERTTVYERSPAPVKGAVTQEVEFTLPGTATIEIATEALDEANATVGEREQRTATVP
jgi:hypothetical protein